MKDEYGIRRTGFIIFWVYMVLLFCVQGASAARIKDLAAIKGIRSNQLSGYGLVVGLNGTGDKDKVSFTRQALANMMEKMNIYVDQSALKVKNVAAAMVTASIPPFARIGDNIDITVSSLGDAKSLKGGILLLTPLKGVDGQVYALAQGPVTLAIPAGTGDRDSHLLVARGINGASIEREIPFKLDGKKNLVLSLFRPDFTTARRMSDTINSALGQDIAKTVDASAIHLKVPETMWKKNVAEFIADIERLSVIPDTIAKVVINEKTGTVVIGSDVTISSVAIAHGDLAVTINQEDGTEKKEKVMNLPGTSTIGELVRGLNSLGVEPRDLISILQSIKAAGALQAEIEII
ncbi:flagellar basal body P-ring protein FlgI [Desulfospira joergensenii]|uniref:flagellar basal body P-ring protein FlgI n=1 Tax=Desulfospira joergensenii TaxID=53329 RepID=UPI0003B5E42F|nr:flagellar basal body P-ring protein FlgI [Desulfospira joergensenii]